jgi:hypothetical protein
VQSFMNERIVCALGHGQDVLALSSLERYEITMLWMILETNSKNAKN